VAWDGNGTPDSDGIYARAFQSDGTPPSAEVMINSTTSSAQSDPAVAMSAPGSALIAWTSQISGVAKIAARRVGALAAPSGSEFNPGVPASGDNEGDSAVGIDSGGNFVIVFDSHSAGVNTWDIFARRYDSSGTALGGAS